MNIDITITSWVLLAIYTVGFGFGFGAGYFWKKRPRTTVSKSDKFIPAKDLI